MATRQCAYNSSDVRCKNWVTSSDEDQTLCPLHAGVMKREPTKEELIQQQRFDNHFSIANMMSNEQLAAHILQLESLLEDVRLRQQAAASVKSRRLKEAAGNGELSEAQKAEIETLRGQKVKTPKTQSASEPKLSKEEKEVQKMMKLGFTREKAIIMLGLDD